MVYVTCPQMQDPLKGSKAGFSAVTSEIDDMLSLRAWTQGTETIWLYGRAFMPEQEDSRCSSNRQLQAEDEAAPKVVTDQLL